MDRYKIILASRSRVFRQYLRGILEAESGLDIAAEVWEGFGLLQLVRRNTGGPLMLILDAPFPHVPWPEAVGKVKCDRPGTDVIVVGAYSDAEYVGMALEAGADGYAVKHSVNIDLPRAIKAIREGGRYVPEGLTEMLGVGRAVNIA